MDNGFPEFKRQILGDIKRLEKTTEGIDETLDEFKLKMVEDLGKIYTQIGNLKTRINAYSSVGGAIAGALITIGINLVMN